MDILLLKLKEEIRGMKQVVDAKTGYVVGVL